MSATEQEYFEQFRGDWSPTYDIDALLRNYEFLKGRRFPDITEERVGDRWHVVIHQAMGTATPWEGSEAWSRELRTARIEAMLPYQETMTKAAEWRAKMDAEWDKCQL